MVHNAGIVARLIMLNEFRGPLELHIDRRQAFQALVVARVIVVFDEAVHGAFKIAKRLVVFEQDAVFQGLMPTLNLAFRLRMVWRAANVIHAIAVEPV